MSQGASEKSGILWIWERPLGTPLGLVQTLPYGVLALDRDEEVAGYHLGTCEGYGSHSGPYPYSVQSLSHV